MVCMVACPVCVAGAAAQGPGSRGVRLPHGLRTISDLLWVETSRSSVPGCTGMSAIPARPSTEASRGVLVSFVIDTLGNVTQVGLHRQPVVMRRPSPGRRTVEPDGIRSSFFLGACPDLRTTVARLLPDRFPELWPAACLRGARNIFLPRTKWNSLLFSGIRSGCPA